MPGSHLFNLGFHQKKFLSTSKITGAAINMGCTKGRGSTTRMFKHCTQNSTNNESCINKFINVPQSKETIESTQSINIFLYSKNNTSSDGFTIGEPVNKDMGNNNYTHTLDPQNYPDYFPKMSSFIDTNIVAGDKSSADRLRASYWLDWKNDIFDFWGYFYIYDVETGKYYFPLISPQNQDDGVITTQTFTAFDRTFTIQHGYPVQGIFKLDISVNDTKSFKFGAYGNMGSDGNSDNTYLTYTYSIDSTDLTLYYVKQQQSGNPNEIIYSYFIPKTVSENNSQTYNFFYKVNDINDTETNLMSNEVTNGLIVYFSKINDVKEWVVNDLGLQ